MVPARDGVGLATDIYRPAGAGPFPVILERTPYDKSAPSRSETHRRDRRAALARRGRARISSRTAMPSSIRIAAAATAPEGSSRNISARPRTAYDTVRLARRGRAGATAASRRWAFPMPRIRRWRSAASTRPALAAQFLDCGGFSNAYRSGIRHGGAFDLKQATWAYRNALADARSDRRPGRARRRGHRAAGSRACRGGLGRATRRCSAAPEYEDYLFEQWSHGAFDEFWRQPGIYAEGYYDQLRRCADGAPVGLVRPLRADRGRELSRPRRDASAGRCA